MTVAPSPPRNNLAVVLNYARSGWRVFPLQARTETPIGALRDGRWRQLATTNHRRIEAWWAHLPAANVGVATGACSGLVVVSAEGAAGEAALRSLCGGEVPSTVTARTPAGADFYFRHPGVPTTNAFGPVLPPHIRLYGDGAFVVAPPSQLAGGASYEWAPRLSPAVVALADPPTALLGVLRPTPSRDGGSTTPVTGVVQPRAQGLLEAVRPATPPPTITTSRNASPPGVNLIRLSEVRPEAVRWLWPGRVACGKVTLLIGDPGVGKSTVALDLAARITAGGVLPTDERLELGSVILLTAEDGLADTVRPRFDAAGGDAAALYVLESVTKRDGTQAPPSLPDDVERLREAIRQTGATLVIVDPLTAYLGGAVNSWRDQDVRGVLAPLVKVADETGAAVLAIMHPNKRVDTPAVYRVSGSIGFAAAARSVLLVAPDRDERGLRVLAQAKSNLGPMPPSLTYTIVPCGQASRVEWRGQSEHDADTLLAEQSRTAERRRRIEEAKELLRSALSGGPRKKAEVLAEAERDGHAHRTVERAASELGVTAARDSFGAAGVWALPAADSGR